MSSCWTMGWTLSSSTWLKKRLKSLKINGFLISEPFFDDLFNENKVYCLSSLLYIIGVLQKLKLVCVGLIFWYRVFPRRVRWTLIYLLLTSFDDKNNKFFSNMCIKQLVDTTNLHTHFWKEIKRLLCLNPVSHIVTKKGCSVSTENEQIGN